MFKYELAIVLIIKNGAPYMREWIEYHLLAGVDHFYIYDNESTDNLQEVLKPYIDAGFVDCKKFPGKSAQCAAYNDAVENYRFDCRYMAFIDDDEFIRPLDPTQSIKDVLREVFDKNPEAAGLTLNGYKFGSSGHETADLSVKVIERFVRRAATPDDLTKIIANPRLVEFVENPHYMNFFIGAYAVNSIGKKNAALIPEKFAVQLQKPVLDKIIFNHYCLKSREEFVQKFSRGDAFFVQAKRDMKQFNDTDAVSNEVFDDGIIHYIYARQNISNSTSTGGGKKFTFESDSARRRRMLDALMRNLMPATFEDVSDEFFTDKCVIFLQCRAIVNALSGKGIEQPTAEYFEDLALRCITRRVLNGNVKLYELLILIEELPKILLLKYPVVDDIKNVCMSFLPNLIMNYRYLNDWKHYNRYNRLLQLLKGMN